MEFRKNDVARNKEVLKTSPGALSKRTLDLSESAAKEAEALVLGAEAKLVQAQQNLDYTKVNAEVTGKISRSQVSLGNLVNAGGGETLLATIVTEDPVYVYFDVPERTLGRYREHFRKTPADGKAEPALEDLKIPVYIGLEGEEGFSYEGMIDYADPRVNASTGVKEVRGTLSNVKRIFNPGMRARVRIPVSDPRKSLLITERAVGTDQGRKFVYVVNDQKIAERRDVKLGRLSGGLQIIAEGLKPEDWVVVNGIQRVRDGAKVDPRQVPMPGATAEPTTPKANR
ncbi:MAG: efflux RND transporter periplasmic adaptor subunit [Gemmataceae bacterium]|nr:efflux RND transporter periplasmic adaptor subunit [Gemmataceae bacterium]